ARAGQSGGADSARRRAAGGDTQHADRDGAAARAVRRRELRACARAAGGDLRLARRSREGRALVRPRRRIGAAWPPARGAAGPREADRGGANLGPDREGARVDDDRRGAEVERRQLRRLPQVAETIHTARITIAESLPPNPSDVDTAHVIRCARAWLATMS